MPGEKKNRFSFTTSDPGRYNICLKNTKVNTLEIKLKLEIGIELLIEMPKTGNEIKSIEDTTIRAKNLTLQLQNEMSGLRKTGFEQHNVNKSTTRNVVIFGVLSVAIIIGSALTQIWYLKRFFRQKKIV